jgi:CrcB protein
VIVVWVGLAGAGGAVGRFALERWITARHESPFAWGTFVVNVSGSFALGVVVGLATAHGLSRDLRLVIGTGFLGAYTTFSTYVYEIVRRVESGNRQIALVYLAASALAGPAAAAVGLALTGGL